MLASIDRTLAEQREALNAAEGRLEKARRSLLELKQADAQDYRALAATRVDQLSRGELERHIDAAAQVVVSLLEARRDALRQLETRAAAAARQRARLEAERAAQAERVDQAAQAVDTAEANTQARLDADSNYRRARELANEAERTATHAAQKADESAREEDAKSASYRADPLFMYLWKRRFGTADQKGGPLTRWLDAKVARLIGYTDARANFARLREIPRRLHEHAKTLEATADAALERLEQLDRAARQADGIDALVVALEAEQHALNALDARIATAAGEERQLSAERTRYMNGEDDHTKQAVAHLAAELEHDDLMALRRDALATPFPEDDRIVQHLLERDDQRRLIEATLGGLQQSVAQQRQRLDELQSIRNDVIRNGYDRPGSSFQSGDLASALLADFVNGLLDRHGLWRILREQQRYRAPRSDTGFGSGAFGRGSVWNGGLDSSADMRTTTPRRRLIRQRRGSSGGFRTGGGF